MKRRLFQPLPTPTAEEIPGVTVEIRERQRRLRAAGALVAICLPLIFGGGLEVTQIQRCVGANAYKRADAARWAYFLHLLGPAPNATVQRIYDQINAYNAKADRQQDCFPFG